MPASPGFLAVVLLGGSVLICLSQQLGLNQPINLHRLSIIPTVIGILIFLFGVIALTDPVQGIISQTTFRKIADELPESREKGSVRRDEVRYNSGRMAFDVRRSSRNLMEC